MFFAVIFIICVNSYGSVFVLAPSYHKLVGFACVSARSTRSLTNSYGFCVASSCQKLYEFILSIRVVASETVRIRTVFVFASSCIRFVASLCQEPYETGRCCAPLFQKPYEFVRLSCVLVSEPVRIRIVVCAVASETVRIRFRFRVGVPEIVRFRLLRLRRRVRTHTNSHLGSASSHQKPYECVRFVFAPSWQKPYEFIHVSVAAEAVRFHMVLCFA